MQVYAIKLHNFIRYGEINNSVVFDLSEQQKLDLASGKITMDNLYEEVKKDPVKHVTEAKARGIQILIGILGKCNGTFNESNGCGKSTLLEGITYCHYDKISRKLRNSNNG